MEIQLEPQARDRASCSMSYGASEHYLGEKGKEYFAWQSGGGDFSARIKAHYFRHLVRPTDTVLDFGCGGGFLLKQLDCSARIGVEINPVARDHARSLGVECYATVADVPNGIADAIITDHALEHVPFPIGALTELRAKLKPEGLLAIRVPIDNWRYHKHRTYDPNDQNHHLHNWTPQQLGNTLLEAGYQVTDISVQSHRWPGNWTVACYGRLPLFLFEFICYIYAVSSGEGHQIFALARAK